MVPIPMTFSNLEGHFHFFKHVLIPRLGKYSTLARICLDANQKACRRRNSKCHQQACTLKKWQYIGNGAKY